MASKYILLTLAIATLALLMHSSVMVTVSQKPPSCKRGMPSKPSKPLGQNVLFNETFNVSVESHERYIEFIERVRTRVALHQNCSIVEGVPMLPPGEYCRNQFFQIIVSDEKNITLRIRQFDLYFVAFQDANGRWYVFRDSNSSSGLDNDTSRVVLPFDTGYGESFRNTTVGTDQLCLAIEILNNLQSNNSRNSLFSARRWLITLMVMFPEAIRFREVAAAVSPNREDYYCPFLAIGTNQTIDRLIHSWGRISSEMRLPEQQRDFIRRIRIPNLTITNVSGVRDVVGILVFVAPDSTNAGEHWTPSNMVGGRWEYPKYPYSTWYGWVLVEIFWVQILNIDKKYHGELYGKIQVVDDRLDTPHYIFNRNRWNSLSIRPKEYIPLTGPTRAISPRDWFYIDVSLMDRNPLSGPDNNVSIGQITWNYSVNVYNQLLWAEVKGKHGSIAVNYAVYGNAVTATVQVKLINVDSDYRKSVYGTINASNTLSNENITLFNIYNKNYVDINPTELIPLLRSVVVVPLISSIKVVANLWVLPDDPIAQGSITFEAATDLCNVPGRISGTYGEVEVMVTWSSSWA